MRRRRVLYLLHFLQWVFLSILVHSIHGIFIRGSFIIFRRYNFFRLLVRSIVRVLLYFEYFILNSYVEPVFVVLEPERAARTNRGLLKIEQLFPHVLGVGVPLDGVYPASIFGSQVKSPPLLEFLLPQPILGCSNLLIICCIVVFRIFPGVLALSIDTLTR